MRTIAGLFLICAASQASVIYTFSASWTDDIGFGVKTYSLGFQFTSPQFYAGGVLNYSQIPNCAGLPYDPSSKCGGAVLESDSQGVYADVLLSSYYNGWSAPGPSGLGVTFTGAALDELGTWTEPDIGQNGVATLTISDPPTTAPEPSTWLLLFLGLAIAPFSTYLKACAKRLR